MQVAGDILIQRCFLKQIVLIRLALCRNIDQADMIWPDVSSCRQTSRLYSCHHPISRTAFMEAGGERPAREPFDPQPEQRRLRRIC
jgi:hypothetical protein